MLNLKVFIIILAFFIAYGTIDKPLRDGIKRNSDIEALCKDGQPVSKVNITDFKINWPGDATGSTHELAINEKFIFVTGQNMDHIAKFDYNGKLIELYKMPSGSGPHGILFNKHGRLWVSLEFSGKVVRLDDTGKIQEEIDVRMQVKGADRSINPAPHGIGLDADGETIWFTGKRTSTVGKINPDKSVQHFPLETLGALPIYLFRGPDGNMWGTELSGSNILHVNGKGNVTEYPIPTTNSRPIAIIPEPDGQHMWFSEEAGVKIGKIDMNGRITEYQVPVLQKNDIVASLCFDREGNLWVQVYVDMKNPKPEGYDYLIKFDKSITKVEGNELKDLSFTIYTLPTRMSVLHRIEMDNEGNLWYTEMMTDKLGKVTLKSRCN